MTTRIGKIGRLSKDRRHELNHRIEDGEPGTEIVQWLNNQPDVQKVLQEQFAGRAITEQNLSDWKQTGHVEWLRRQEAREAIGRLTEQADDLDEAVPARNLSDRFATVLASEMTRLAAALLKQEADPEKRWKRLCEIHRELSQLRRDDHRAARTVIRQERWTLEMERGEEEEIQRREQAHKERRIEILLAGRERRSNAELIFGGGESGRNKAEMLYRLRCDLPIDDLLDGTWSEKAGPVPAKAKPEPPAEAGKSPEKSPKSSLIKANPAKKIIEAIKPQRPNCKSNRSQTQSRTGAQAVQPTGKPGFSSPASCQQHRDKSIRPAAGGMHPIIPSSPTHTGSIPIKPADNNQMTPEQARIEEERRLWRIQHHFEDPATSTSS
jgi:hypothetical protein